jgi:hypothetical protein
MYYMVGAGSLVTLRQHIFKRANSQNYTTIAECTEQKTLQRGFGL